MVNQGHKYWLFLTSYFINCQVNSSSQRQSTENKEHLPWISCVSSLYNSENRRETETELKMKSETLTLVLVNLAGMMERADESLLPGVYKEVGAALHTDPTGLGSLTLFRSIVQSLCYPLAMYFAVRHDRTHVIALGAFLWAAATFLVGFSSTFFQVAVSRGLNGIGLAMVTPAIQSLVADSTEDHNRGVAFGWLGLTGNIGSILGGLLSILLASTSFMGIAGWRISFHLVAVVSIVVGILVRLYAKDPMFVEKNSVNGDSSPGKSLLLELKEFLEEAKSVMKIPSFQILIAQGVSGSFPWSALAFAPMWLELIGFTHKETAFLWSMFQVACSIGGLFGGKMGDILSIHLPNSGRIILSQISAGSFIPLAWILMFGLPDDPSTALKHGLALFIMGLFTSWNVAATNYPIFAEIVPKKSRTSIYALDQSFESVLASFAPPIVGLLSQHVFGYTPAPQGSSQSVELETDRKNAASLAKALYTSIAIPITICALIYSFLYCTYPRDRDRAKMNAVIESEMEQLESDKLPIEGKYCQIQASEVYEKETAIELDCEVKDGLEVDDSDEKTLLTHE
ncbi:uncharacterized protein LOC113335938 [Papaver somniferum]|uniref:uncharacterized protein LOC113335938 n=1 Tax=Papaver somniferum TaxID=3469 RepID=UPI000E703966|nr:uncharacterized protein LOC113335938 [Papaver somniferum]